MPGIAAAGSLAAPAAPSGCPIVLVRLTDQD
jgi:hypothetical protein